MKSTLYLSEAWVEFTSSDLQLLVSQAASTNAKNGITGFLSFVNNRFIQYIEGPDQKLDTLMDKIECDKRHTVIVSIELPITEQRRFGSWGMRVIKNNEFGNYNIESEIENSLLDINADKTNINKSLKVIDRNLSIASQMLLSRMIIQDSRRFLPIQPSKTN